MVDEDEYAYKYDDPAGGRNGETVAAEYPEGISGSKDAYDTHGGINQNDISNNRGYDYWAYIKDSDYSLLIN